MKTWILLFATCLFVSCSPQKLLKRGNPEKAYTIALKQLHKEKAVAKNEEILNQSLQKLIANQSIKKNGLIQKGKLDALEEALLINGTLQNYIKDAVGFLSENYEDEINFFDEEERWLTKKCADLAFHEGSWKWEKAQSNNDKRLAQAAYRNFLKANDYQYENIKQLLNVLEQSFEFGQIIYGIDPIEYDASFSKMKESNDQFLRIIPLNQIEESACDCIVSINYDSPHTSDNTIVTSNDYEKEIEDGYDIEIVEECQTNSNGEQVIVEVEKEVTTYKTIKATVRVTEITRSTRSSAGIKVVRKTENCKLKNQSWCDSVEDQIRDVDVCGDKRAITGCVPSDSGIMLDSRATMESNVYGNLQFSVHNYLMRSK